MIHFDKIEGNSKVRISKSINAINQNAADIMGPSPREQVDTSRALIKDLKNDEEIGDVAKATAHEKKYVTVNDVKKYNRQLRKIESGDGSTIDLGGPSADLYTYTVLMLLNPNVE